MQCYRLCLAICCLCSGLSAMLKSFSQLLIFSTQPGSHAAGNTDPFVKQLPPVVLTTSDTFPCKHLPFHFSLINVLTLSHRFLPHLIPSVLDDEFPYMFQGSTQQPLPEGSDVSYALLRASHIVHINPVLYSIITTALCQVLY